MILPAGAVLVPPHLAVAVLELALPEVRSRDEKGLRIAQEVRDLLADLARSARPTNPVPTGSDPGSDRFHNVIVDGMDTTTAAARLGITQRAVIKRIHAGRLAAQQQPDGAWLIDPKEISECA